MYFKAFIVQYSSTVDRNHEDNFGLDTVKLSES